MTTPTAATMHRIEPTRRHESTTMKAITRDASGPPASSTSETSTDRRSQSVTGIKRFAAAAAMSPVTRQRLVPLFSKPTSDDLAAVVELAGTGAVRPIVGRIFDLTDTAEAIRQIETGHGTGRTVVTT